MNHRYDVIIVGGGVVGAALFHALAMRPGRSVLLVEKGRAAQGSTGASGGIVRCFHDDPEVAAMAVEGQAYYRAFGARTGTDVAFTTCGYLHFVYPAQQMAVQDTVASLARAVEMRWLTPAAGALRFPDVHWTGLAGAVFEPAAGYMDARAVTRAWITAAEARGGVFHEGVHCSAVLHADGQVAGIATNLGTYHAGQVVLCAGAWSAALAAAAGLALPQPVRAKAIQLNAFDLAAPGAAGPAWSDPHTGIYGRAQGPGRMYLGCAVPEWDGDPDTPAVPDLAWATAARTLGAGRFAWASTAVLAGGLRRFDAFASTERGIVAADAGVRGLFWATGF